MTNTRPHDEIERKYLIAMPDRTVLAAQDGAETVQIRQCYLSGGPGGRLRMAVSARGTVYIHTIKTRLTDVRRVEYEREISAAEYSSLLEYRDPSLNFIDKIRYRIPYGGLTAEVDLFSFWNDRAILEFELDSELQKPEMPPWLHVIREVTHDRRYTNLALAREVPMETLPQAEF